MDILMEISVDKQDKNCSLKMKNMLYNHSQTSARYEVQNLLRMKNKLELILKKIDNTKRHIYSRKSHLISTLRELNLTRPRNKNSKKKISQSLRLHSLIQAGNRTAESLPPFNTKNGDFLIENGTKPILEEVVLESGGTILIDSISNPTNEGPDCNHETEEDKDIFEVLDSVLC